MLGAVGKQVNARKGIYGTRGFATPPKAGRWEVLEFEPGQDEIGLGGARGPSSLCECNRPLTTASFRIARHSPSIEGKQARTKLPIPTSRPQPHWTKTAYILFRCNCLASDPIKFERSFS